jgi:hypothetical protein
VQGEITLKHHYFETFLGLVTADLDVLYAAGHPPPDGGSGLLVVDGSDDPLQPSFEAVLG